MWGRVDRDTHFVIICLQMDKTVRRMNVIRKGKGSGLGLGVAGKFGETSGQRTEEKQELIPVSQFCASPPFLQVENMS